MVARLYRRPVRARLRRRVVEGPGRTWELREVVRMDPFDCWRPHRAPSVSDMLLGMLGGAVAFAILSLFAH